MVSVAMCTYNGAKYLPEQLKSIADQTVLVDELVVCDDRSKDDTIAIIQAFAATSKFPVHIHINGQNLGSTKNFEKCLSLCQGDIILLSDQDDKWRVDRVQKQVDYLTQHLHIDAVFSDAMMMDDYSEPTGKTIWQEIEFDKRGQTKWKNGKPYEILYNGFVVTGATMAIRKSCLQRLTPFPTHVPDLIHDAWIAVVLSLQGKIDFIPETLIYYRMHPTQQVGFGSKIDKVLLKDRFVRNREKKLGPIREKADKLNELYLLLRAIPFVPREKLIKLYLAQKHYYCRASLPDNRLRRINPVINQAARGYYRFSSKDWWLPALGDLFE